jgi:ABC-2 type transport system ATP-binding protein
MLLMLDLDHGAGETRFDRKRFRDTTTRRARAVRCLRRRPSIPPRQPATTCGCWLPPKRIPTSRVDEVFDIVGLAEVKKPNQARVAVSHGLIAGVGQVHAELHGVVTR